MRKVQHQPGGRLFVLADHKSCISGDTMARVIDCHAKPIAARIVQCVNAHEELLAAVERNADALANFHAAMERIKASTPLNASSIFDDAYADAIAALNRIEDNLRGALIADAAGEQP